MMIDDREGPRGKEYLVLDTSHTTSESLSFFVASASLLESLAVHSPNTNHTTDDSPCSVAALGLVLASCIPDRLLAASTGALALADGMRRIELVHHTHTREASSRNQLQVDGRMYRRGTLLES